MSIKTVIIDLESIQVPAMPATSNVSIEALANSIVELRGLLRPPILRSIGIDEYEVLAGQIEFYAYLQARKFDDSLPDRLTVFLIDKRNEAAIQQQVGMVPIVTESNFSDLSNIAISNLDAKLERLLTNQSKLISNSDTSSLEDKLENLFSNQIKLINNLQDNLLASLRQFHTQPEKTISHVTLGVDRSPSQPILILEAFNRVEEQLIGEYISRKLAFLGEVKVGKIIKLLKAAKKQKKIFTSIQDVQDTSREPGKKVRLLGDKSMSQLLARWN